MPKALCGATSPSMFNIALEKMGSMAQMDVCEEGTLKEKNDAVAVCRKYIGQMMWLTTIERGRTLPPV